MRVLAIDPGFDRVGCAVLEKSPGSQETLLHSECIQSNTQDAFTNRLFFVGEGVARLIEKWHPDDFAIETLIFNKNQKTAMRVAEARGTFLYIARKHNVGIYEYNPLQIKMAITGYGQAEKSQVDMMVRNLITIEKESVIDDEMDAVAVGLTHIASKAAIYPHDRS